MGLKMSVKKTKVLKNPDEILQDYGREVEQSKNTHFCDLK